MSDLDALLELLQPPHAPRERPTEAHWREAERGLGVILPMDFKSVLDAYGSGSIDDFLILLNPADRQPGGNLLAATNEILGMKREIHQFSPIPYPLHPDPGGLLPWGRTSNGHNAFWLTSPLDDPGRWPVVIDEARGPGWSTYSGTVTQLLVDVLAGRTRVSVFPEDWPGTAPTFWPAPETGA